MCECAAVAMGHSNSHPGFRSPMEPLVVLFLQVLAQIIPQLSWHIVLFNAYIQVWAMRKVRRKVIVCWNDLLGKEFVSVFV